MEIKLIIEGVGDEEQLKTRIANAITKALDLPKGANVKVRQGIEETPSIAELRRELASAIESQTDSIVETAEKWIAHCLHKREDYDIDHEQLLHDYVKAVNTAIAKLRLMTDDIINHEYFYQK